MRNKFIHIYCVIALILIILLGITYIYKSLSNKEENSLEVMIENNPEQENEKNEEESDELIIEKYEINGKVYEVIAVLYIPSLEIEYPVLSSTSKELLKVSLNKYWGPNPNRPGNFCIVGHNYNDSRFLGKLNKIQKGEVIQLTDMSGKILDYYVYDTYIVDPVDTSCTSQLTEGRTELTLITCTATGKQRFIVKARAYI